MRACVCVETDSAEKIQALAVARGVELTPLPARDVERAAQLSAGCVDALPHDLAALPAAQRGHAPSGP